ncbi:DNA mismatch repair protein msh6 [Tulasnella sp. 332]|nr:DNA mismatch repair protein msh6 [Tulasnella sp. 332]
MPPKDVKDSGKQKTLYGFFSKAPVKSSNDTSASASAALNQSTSSATTVTSETERQTRRNVMSTPIDKGSRTTSSSSGLPSSSSSAAKSTASERTQAIDVDMDDGDESEPIVTKKKPLKRKVVAYDSDGEDVDLEKFSLKLSQFQRPSLAGRSSITGSDASSSASKPGRMAKRRRTSIASADEDDFIAGSDSDDEEEEGRPAKSSGSRRGSSSASEVDANIGSDEDLDEGDMPKKRLAKPKQQSKPIRPAAKPSAGTQLASNQFLTEAERRTQETKQDKKGSEECYSFLLDIQDKDGNRESDPGYDPRTILIPKRAWSSFTPFEKQFWEIKQNHWDTVLFFQKGKFYELYENDAQIGHTVFDLKLTDRVKMKMVGVPESTFEMWAGKFLAKGYKVGRVDQVETSLGAEMRLAAAKSGGSKAKPSGTGGKEIVRRELSKVLTTGTLVDGHMLTDDQAGHCVSIRELEEEDTFGICILDASTGEFNLSSFPDDNCRTKLETIMRQLRLKELVYTKGNLSVPTTRLLKNILPSSCLWTALRSVEGYSYDETIEALDKLFRPATKGDDDDAMDEDDQKQSEIPEGIKQMLDNRTAVEAIGAMIWYLRQLNIDKDLLGMKNFNIYDPMRQGQGLILDGQTLSHIEVLQNSEGTDEGSLHRILNRCITPFGKRLFRIWLCMPLREVSAINDRLDAVQDLMNAPTLDDAFNNLAKGLPDLERIVSRIHAGSCKVVDFLKVLQAFRKLSAGFKALEGKVEEFESKSISGLLRAAPDLNPYIKNLEKSFVPPKEKADDLLIPRDGCDEAYDEVEAEISDLTTKLDDALSKLSKKTGAKLQFWHSSQGTKEIYLVQSPAGQKGIPKEWTKASGTKAVNRWNVPELAGMIRSYKEAQENKNAAIRNFKSKVYADFDTDREMWLRLVRTMAELDCLFSLSKASIAIGEPSCRPEFVESDEAFVDFTALRHPALCLRDDFIPNDVKMGKSAQGIMLLTGANMAGKSTMMRMTAAGIIMAQLGMFVPAEAARIAPVDKILTRMGAYDNMFSNASTFRVEMDEAAGTGYLNLHFAYHPNIKNMHMKTAVDDEKRELVFLYKLTEGIASSSFGTHVASLAGVPPAVVTRAEVISDDFAAQFQKKLDTKRTSTLSLMAQADFAYLWKLTKGELSVDADPVRARRVMRMIAQATPTYVKANTPSAPLSPVTGLKPFHDTPRNSEGMPPPTPSISISSSSGSSPSLPETFLERQTAPADGHVGDDSYWALYSSVGGTADSTHPSPRLQDGKKQILDEYGRPMVAEGYHDDEGRGGLGYVEYDPTSTSEGWRVGEAPESFEQDEYRKETDLDLADAPEEVKNIQDRLLGLGIDATPMIGSAGLGLPSPSPSPSPLAIMLQRAYSKWRAQNPRGTIDDFLTVVRSAVLP